MENNFIDRRDLYIHDDTPEGKERTRARLTQMQELDMYECSLACFGVRNVMSGLYIELVWNYGEQQWDDYMKWVTDLIAEKKPIVDQARINAISKLRSFAENGIDVFTGRFEVRNTDKTLHIDVTRGMDGQYYIHYYEGFSFYTFNTTPAEVLQHENV